MKSTHSMQRPTVNLGENEDLLLLSKHLPLAGKTVDLGNAGQAGSQKKRCIQNISRKMTVIQDHG